MPNKGYTSRVSGVKGDFDVSDAEVKLLKLKVDPQYECQRCGHKRCHVKEHVKRRVNHLRLHNGVQQIELHTLRMQCPKCKKTYTCQAPGILSRTRSSEAFRQQAFEDHQGGHSHKHLSRVLGVSHTTIDRWNRHFLTKRLKETQSRRITCPRYLGIDEHFFTRKSGYASTFCDLNKGTVFDLALGRSEPSLKAFLKRLKGKDKVKIITMDLSPTYRSIVRKYFRNAKIIADRFHVVRLVIQAFHKVIGLIDPEMRYQKGFGKLLKTNVETLDDNQKNKLAEYFKKNPIIEAVYIKREQLLKKLRLKSIGQYGARAHVQEFLSMIEELQKSPWESLASLGRTLEEWSEEIVRTWRSKYSNGVVEGFHNKMELLSRRAYGFRNFENYRMRVLALCGWNGLFAPRNAARLKNQIPRKTG